MKLKGMKYDFSGWPILGHLYLMIALSIPVFNLFIFYYWTECLRRELKRKTKSEENWKDFYFSNRGNKLFK